MSLVYVPDRFNYLGVPFKEKMKKLTSELAGQFGESAKLDEAIKKNLEGLGYGL